MTQTLPNTDSTTGSTLTNATTSASALSARDLVKVYGRGDAEVRALDGAPRSRTWHLHRHHGPVGIWEVDPAAHPGRSRRPRLRTGPSRRHRARPR